MKILRRPAQTYKSEKDLTSMGNVLTFPDYRM